MSRPGAARSERAVLASGNQGKLAELREILRPLAMEVVAQSDLGVPEAEETGVTFIENALIKARNACVHTGLAAFADDSGLEVDALDGAPGVYSARYAGKGSSDADNVDKLLTALSEVPAEERTARFHSVVVFMRWAEDPTPIVCHGWWNGWIVDAPRGAGGFGYDPVFAVPERAGQTAAEIDSADKNELSHRGKALAQLLEAFQRYT